MAVPTIPDHIARAIARLQYTFDDSQTVQDMVEAYIQEFQVIEDTFIDIQTQRDLNQASGQQLDGLGQLLNVSRNEDSDDVYRLRLQAQTIANLASGTKPEVINLILVLAKTTAAYAALTPAEQAALTLSVRIEEYFPASFIANFKGLGLTAEDIVQMGAALSNITAAGVGSEFTSLADGDSFAFKYSDTAGTPTLSSDNGFDNGSYVGYAGGQV